MKSVGGKEAQRLINHSAENVAQNIDSPCNTSLKVNTIDTLNNTTKT